LRQHCDNICANILIMGNITIVPTLLGHRIDKSGKSQIVIRVRTGKSFAHTDKLNYKVPPDFWDPESRLVKKNYPNAGMMNSLIKKRVAELEEQFLHTELLGGVLTKSKVKKIAKGEALGSDFLGFCKAHILDKYPKSEQKETRRSYNGEITKLQKFQSEVSFADIDYSFLKKYKAYMINDLANHDNTVWKTLKWMNTMINDAIKIGGLIRDNPFKEFNRGKYKQGKRNYLEISDCDKIHELMSKEIPDQLRVIAAYYLFMCYTGLRFGDATKQFQPTIHIQNNERIIITTAKYDQEVNLLIHDRLRSVLDIVINNPLQITNKDFNKYLKVVATMSEIPVNLTAHVGRHTFGATLAEMNVPIERAQKLLGHRDKKSTEIYYHIKNKVLDSEMRKWDEL
jgi:integrase/recombinase XerD